MLEESGLPQKVVANVEKIGAKKTAHFATYVSEPSEVTRFVRGVDFEGDDDAKDSALAMLRLVWMQCKANLEHGLKRKASGLMEEVPEGPLPPEVQQAIVDTSCKLYLWEFVDPQIICTDSVVGKIRREFQSWAHTVFPIAKATSQAAAMAVHSTLGKKQRLTDRLCLVDDLAEAEDETKAKDTLPMVEFLENFERLTMTWTVAGCYYVVEATPTDANAQVLYVKQHEVDSYRREFTFEAVSLRRYFTEGSSVRYLTAVEESMRRDAVKNARPPKKRPFGRSLVASVEAKASSWTKFRNLLLPRTEPNKPKHQPVQPLLALPGVPALPGLPPNGGGGGGGMPKGSPKKPRQRERRTSNQKTTQAGERPCFHFNSKEGCKQKDCRFAHVCSKLLSNGFLCGGKHRNIDCKSS